MRPPGSPTVATRELVLGYVQSGKTTNFMSVVAKAADVGYRLFVVLSGITDNLRFQTQDRLDDFLVGENAHRWYLLTDAENDFVNPGNAANLLGPGDDRLLAVIKKNPSRLRRLLRWLDSAGQAVLQECPILIVDDEADQASVDVGSKGRTSRINGLIRQILDKPKAAYIAYTATPFANLLIDPSTPTDLYPRDFIVELPKPGDYFGPEKVFGREPITAEEGEDGTDGLDLYGTSSLTRSRVFSHLGPAPMSMPGTRMSPRASRRLSAGSYSRRRRGVDGQQAIVTRACSCIPP